MGDCYRRKLCSPELCFISDHSEEQEAPQRVTSSTSCSFHAADAEPAATLHKVSCRSEACLQALTTGPRAAGSPRQERREMLPLPKEPGACCHRRRPYESRHHEPPPGPGVLCCPVVTPRNSSQPCCHRKKSQTKHPVEQEQCIIKGTNSFQQPTLTLTLAWKDASAQPAV